MLSRQDVDQLFAADLPEVGAWEATYPQRDLPPGAKVTRFGPSPTGFVHIGGVYVAMISKDVAQHSGGSYFVRIEDTDQAREVVDAGEQFDRAFGYFDIASDESDTTSSWGPYRQSARERIYLSHARELMRNGLAYPCFCGKDELAEITAAQNAAKVPTGYYGRWARWRDAPDEEVLARLAAGDAYVVRLRSPGVTSLRVSYDDVIRGTIEHEDNRNDIVLLKTSAAEPRLPTYHLAHVVDDHLMRVNLVIRAEEWISSVPVHHQLFDALGFERIEYAHIAPLMKQAGSSKRKLSKRKDPEASVDFYIAAGYPAAAILHYLRSLANGRLADLPFDIARAEPIRLSECGVAGPLIDMAKLDDISGNYIATLDSASVLANVEAWALDEAPHLLPVLAAEHELALRAVSVERVGVANPRKDLVKWSDFEAVYGFFLTGLFTPVTDPADERFLGLAPDLVRAVAADFVAGYTEHDDQPVWFDQVRKVAVARGFAASAKELKASPGAFPGSIREASNVIRVALTGSTRSPDLHAVALALGPDEVRRRVGVLAASD
jgi:glutamyl-tRNA synthetase